MHAAACPTRKATEVQFLKVQLRFRRVDVLIKLWLQEIISGEHQQIALSLRTGRGRRRGRRLAHPVLKLGTGRRAGPHTLHRGGHVGLNACFQIPQFDGLAEKALDEGLLQSQWFHRIQHASHEGDGHFGGGGHLAETVQQGPSIHAPRAEHRIQERHIEPLARIHPAQGLFGALQADQIHGSAGQERLGNAVNAWVVVHEQETGHVATSGSMGWLGLSYQKVAN